MIFPTMDLYKVIYMFHIFYILSTVIFALEAMKNYSEGIERKNNHGGSKAEKACERYTKQACNGKSHARIMFKSHGNQLLNIVGGEKVRPKEYPHMAALGSHYASTYWYCSATLISSRYVVTAGHCVVTFKPEDVRFGDLNLWSSHDDASAILKKVKNWIIHPDYVDEPTLLYDIALVEFERLSSFTDHVRPACLNVHEHIPTQSHKMTVAGWGAIREYGPLSADLLSVKIVPQDPALCRNKLPFHDKSMICAGYRKGKKDACQGDSGGPLTVLNTKFTCSVPIYSLVGVVSKGEGCAMENSPGMYSRISHFIPWIESIVWK